MHLFLGVLPSVSHIYVLYTSKLFCILLAVSKPWLYKLVASSYINWTCLKHCFHINTTLLWRWLIKISGSKTILLPSSYGLIKNFIAFSLFSWPTPPSFECLFFFYLCGAACCIRFFPVYFVERQTSKNIIEISMIQSISDFHLISEAHPWS